MLDGNLFQIVFNFTCVAGIAGAFIWLWWRR